MGTAWSDRLVDERAKLFVGRDREQAELRSLLCDPTARLLYLQGLGGMGKTTLLARFQRNAVDAGWFSLRVDGRAIAPRPDAFEREAGAARARRALLFVDSFERLHSLEGWLREVFFPSLDAETRVVMAGRERLSARWMADPGWRALVWSRALGPLSRAEAVEYLERCGVAPERFADIADACAGHPLALTLAAHGPEGPSPDETARAQAARFFHDLRPDERETVAIAALNDFVTAALLGEAHDPARARARFEWLASQRFVQPAPPGIAMHDVVRDGVLDELAAEPAWRDQLTERSYEITVRSIDALAEGPERDAWLGNALCLLAIGARGRPEALPEEWYSDRPRLAEADELVAIARRHFGDASAEIARHWLEHAWEGAVVGRGSNGVILGYCQFLDLRLARGELGSVDPVIRAIEPWLDRVGLTTEPAVLCRFFATADAPLDPGVPGFTFMKDEMQRRLMLGGATFIAAAQPAATFARFAELRLHPLVAEPSVGGVPWTVTAHDLREYSALEFLYSMLVRLRTVAPPSTDDNGPDRALFEAEVRRALKAFHRGDRLAESQLGAWLELPCSSDERAAALRDRLRDAASRLGSSGGDAIHVEVIDATFFRDSAKQSAVARDLGMSFSTYRRHLTAAIARLSDALWDERSGTSRGQPSDPP